MQEQSKQGAVVVRLRNWVGDVVLGLPALHLLQQHGHSLHLVGKGWAPALLEAEGWPIHVRPSALGDRVRQLRSLRQTLKQADPGFDRRPNALVLPTSFSAAMDMRLAGLKAEGYGQEARGFLLHRSHPITYGGHALTSYWTLACRFLGVDLPPPDRIDLPVSEAQLASAQRLLDEHGIGPGFVVICPFAGGTFEKLDKTWPLFGDFTRALAVHLRAQGRQVVVCPGPGGERDVALAQHPDAIMLEGVKLGVYNALLKLSGMVVSNDTGPAHMAAAVGAPVLSVLGPTKPEQWAPWGPTVDIIRHWPRWPTVDEVMARVVKVTG